MRVFMEQNCIASADFVRDITLSHDVIAAVFVTSGAGRAANREPAPEAATRPAAGTDQHASQTHRHHTPAYNLVHTRSNGYTAHTARHGSVAAVRACQ